MRKLLLFILIGFNLSCFAQYSDAELYHAYLQRDLSLWGKYINESTWENLPQAEQERMMNYQYGYVANLINENKHNKEYITQQLELFEQHLQLSNQTLTPATFYAYRSASAAYHISLGSWKVISYGLKSMTDAKKALEIDSLNPLVIALYGNVMRFAPKSLGGDTKVGLQYYLKAEKAFQEKGLTSHNWNYRAVQLFIVQSYEDLKMIPLAIQKCEEILNEEPNYTFIRDIYLPKLKEKNK